MLKVLGSKLEIDNSHATKRLMVEHSLMFVYNYTDTLGTAVHYTGTSSTTGNYTIKHGFNGELHTYTRFQRGITPLHTVSTGNYTITHGFNGELHTYTRFQRGITHLHTLHYTGTYGTTMRYTGTLGTALV